MLSRAIAVGLALLGVACGPAPKPVDKTAEVFWRPLGSWSGRGNLQTESMTTDSGSLRVRWEAKSTGDGSSTRALRLTAQSAISGRPLKVAVDEHGPGKGTAYVDADPHVFYILVEATNLDWHFTVEEGFSGSVARPF